MTPDEFNELIDECIDHLCDDNPEYGAESLQELAMLWAKTPYGRQSFNNIRQHIVQSAIERLGIAASPFIHYKLQVAEQKLMHQRKNSGNRITLNYIN